MRLFTRRSVAVGLVAAPLILRGAAAHGQDTTSVVDLKSEIVRRAEGFLGEGDPDFARQAALQPLIEALLRAAPQPPVRDRLDALSAPWRQVWGPYDYRRPDSRGVDPTTDPEHIFQVVSRSGHYWNVAPRDVRDSDRRREIALLRGVYTPSDVDPDMLRVRFTEFVSTRTDGALDDIWRIAESAESGALAERRTVVPRLVVRLFFGGGGLREVYTDDTLRITYGATSLTDRRREFVYVMRRADL